MVMIFNLYTLPGTASRGSARAGYVVRDRGDLLNKKGLPQLFGTRKCIQGLTGPTNAQ
jgi:hypothetical protein